MCDVRYPSFTSPSPPLVSFSHPVPRCYRAPSKRGWVFEFNRAEFFVTCFAPCYGPTNSRYAFGVADAAYVLFQPYYSFLVHGVGDDTPHTGSSRIVVAFFLFVSICLFAALLPRLSSAVNVIARDHRPNLFFSCCLASIRCSLSRMGLTSNVTRSNPGRLPRRWPSLLYSTQPRVVSAGKGACWLVAEGRGESCFCCCCCCCCC